MYSFSPSQPSINFVLNVTATPHIYTLSLHDALPISVVRFAVGPADDRSHDAGLVQRAVRAGDLRARSTHRPDAFGICSCRSEEHTSELQSQFHLVCRLLLEKKNHNIKSYHNYK